MVKVKLIWGMVVRLGTLIIGTAYPAYKSVEALESKGTLDDSQWLTYWLLSAIITLVERLFSPVLMYIPFYTLFKGLFLAWLVLPQFNGSNELYNRARPWVLLLKHHFDLILGKKQADAPGSNPEAPQLKKVFNENFPAAALGKEPQVPASVSTE